MLIDLLKEIWFFTKEVSVYLLGGFFLAGVVRAFFTEKTVARYLGGRRLRSVLNASLLGIPLPLCSCSVLPTAAALRKGGASRAATSSFLISTPETGVDSIAVSYAMLDPLMTVARPVAALVTALATGAADFFINPEPAGQTRPVEPLESPAAGQGQQSPLHLKLAEGLHYSFFVLFADLSWYLAWGLILAGLVSFALPPDLFGALPGGKPAATAVILAMGIPLYICATSSTPLAAALIAKGLSPGLALILLLVGPATNISSLTVIWRILGPRSTAVYLAGVAVSALACGLLLDYIYSVFKLDPKAALGAALEVFPAWLETAGAVILILFLAYGIYKEKIRPRFRKHCGA
ncbi:MAG TPA: permease [archaeon]|nr:permease [archaeon]